MAFFALSIRARTAAAVFAATSLVVVGGSGLVAGCSSSSDAAAAPDSGSNNCPTTLATAIGASCSSVDPCVVGFLCPQSLNEIATCNCVKNAWVCEDGQHNPITDPAAETNCTSLGGGNDSQCPADETSANFASCKTPGLICSYAGPTCPGAAAANTDTCQCVGAASDDGGAILQYNCSALGCIVPTEAGQPEVDSGHD